VAADRIVARRPDVMVSAMFLDNRMVQAGGLVSFGVRNDIIDPTPFRMIARILRGESPAAIPVAQMMRTHMAVNLRTARAMKLAVPDSLRLRADEVID
jgi:putative ABC transport system substrate-binding protein